MLGLRMAIPVFAITTLLVVPLHATTSYYADTSQETNFNGALGGLTLLNPTMTFLAVDLGSGGLFNASGTGINYLGYDDFNNPGIDFTVSSGKLTATQQDQRVQISFPLLAPVYAFGFHFTFVSGTAPLGNWCLGLTRGSCTYSLVNANAATSQFFGIISDTPLTGSVFIQAAGSAPSIVFTNFEAFSVPEPNTMLLVGMGLVIVSLFRRKILPLA